MDPGLTQKGQGKYEKFYDSFSSLQQQWLRSPPFFEDAAALPYVKIKITNILVVIDLECNISLIKFY